MEQKSQDRILALILALVVLGGIFLMIQGFKFRPDKSLPENDIRVIYATPTRN